MEALRNMNLPPGFGFYPSDTELVGHYLKRKILGQKIEHDLIPEVDIYKHEPWDLPAKCNFPIEDNKWHFFASRDRKYPTGSRSNRATVAGYWKSTGKDRAIKLNKRTLGTKKTLVFHEGRPPSGRRTEWIMHEYYIDEKECQVSPDMKDAFVLCRVTKRNDWALENDNEVGNMNPHPQQLNDAATSVVSVVKPEAAAASVISAEEPNDVALAPITANTEPPNGDYDLDALLERMLDPLPSFNPVADTGSANLPQTEQYAESSNAGFMTSKIEPDHANPNQDVIDDRDYLLSDDLQSLWYDGIDEFTMFFKQADQRQVYSMMRMDTFDLPNTSEVGTLKDELQLDQENNNPSLSNGNIDNGFITRRHRATASADDVSQSRHRFKMQVGIKKMVASNSESINQTMKFAVNSGRRQEHANDATSVKQSGAAKPSEAHSNLGYLRGIKNAFRCSSAGFKAFALFMVLVVGVASVALHYHRSGASL